MTPQELENVHALRAAPIAAVDLAPGLTDQRDRTLLYGYDCDRNTWHVYLKDGVIHRIVYPFRGDVLVEDVGPDHVPAALVPDKRLYPERCDFEFCMMLARLGVAMSFTVFGQDPTPGVAFHGRLIGQPVAA